MKVMVAPLEDALALHNALANEAKKCEIDPNMELKDLSLESFMTVLPKIALGMMGSTEIQEVAFKCLNRCLRDGVKITRQTFEDEKAREDYYTCVIECIKVNVAPFTKGLAQSLQGLIAKANTATAQK